MVALKRCALLCMLLLLLLPAAARGDMPDETQLAPLEALSGLDFSRTIQSIMDGEGLDFGQLLAQVRQSMSAAFGRGAALLASLLTPVILLCVVRQLAPEDEKKLLAASYVCYLASALALMGAFSQVAGEALALIGSVGRLMEALFPILGAMLVACGATVSAANSAVLLTLGSGVLSGMLVNVALSLCGCAAVIAICGTLSERFSLGKLLGLLKDVLFWMCGLALTGFTALVALQNLLGAGGDGAAMRTAKYAVGSLIPGVGGEVADSMGAVSMSAALLKNATGASGILALLLLCARPLLLILTSLLSLRLAVALAEPLGSGPVHRLIDRFSDVFAMLMVAAAASVVVGLILVGAVLNAGNAQIIA